MPPIFAIGADDFLEPASKYGLLGVVIAALLYLVYFLINCLKDAIKDAREERDLRLSSFDNNREKLLKDFREERESAHKLHKEALESMTSTVRLALEETRRAVVDGSIAIRENTAATRSLENVVRNS